MTDPKSCGDALKKCPGNPLEDSRQASESASPKVTPKAEPKAKPNAEPKATVWLDNQFVSIELTNHDTTVALRLTPKEARSIAATLSGVALLAQMNASITDY